MLGTCHRVRRARCRLRARRTCCSYPLARPCAVVWCCVLAGPRLSARAMLPSACLAHGGETEVETARARLSGVVPRTVSTLVSIHRHHSKRRQPKGHDLGLSRLASSARRALELKARVASEPPAPASRHGSFRDRLYYLGVQRSDPLAQARRDSTVAQHTTRQPLRQPGRGHKGG